MNKLILGLLILSSLFASAQKEITVENIWKEYQFRSKGVEGFNTLNDGESYLKIEMENGKKSLIKYQIQNKQKEVVVVLDDLLLQGKKVEIDDYQFNTDETKLVFQSQTESVYRRSYTAVHYLYDLKTKSFELLDEKHSPQTLAEFSPDGTKIAYIYKNDLYVKDLATKKITPLTTDGKRNKIINGTTDWVYEEEFGITKGFEWSPDSKMIAFLKFNEKEVKEFQMAIYNDLYPEQYKFKYPKAGEDNAKVTLHIVPLKTKKISTIGLSDYEYIPRLKWANHANQLIVQTLNRHQNDLKYWIYDATRKSATVFHEEKSNTYVEIDDNLCILKDGSGLIRTSEKSGYNQLYKIAFDGKETALNQGDFDVIEFLGIQEETHVAYYTAAKHGAIHKGIYSVNLNDLSEKALSIETGYNDATFLKGMKYFIKTYSDANTPNKYTLCDASGNEIRILETNTSLIEKMNGYALTKKEFITFPMAEGYVLNAWMMKPANFDPTKKYPVYMTVYGGPGSNKVLNRFDGQDYFYYQLLTQKGYIVMSVDPRGTMYQGAAFKKSTYLQLGKLEIEDVIKVAQLMQREPFVDANRIGIQGWSYGGFMASLGMTKGADVFKMGIAVAPVTNWRYYDNIYTERFMRTPQENEKGYDDNSPINHVEKLKGNYLLIHGSADDNVHYQNTMEMIDALVKANKQFDLFIYPNKNHGIYGGNTRNHLFNLLLNYTLKNL